MEIRNLKIEKRECMCNSYYVVIGDTERFGEQEILFESPFWEEVKAFLKQNRYRNRKPVVKFELEAIQEADVWEGTEEVLELTAHVSCASEQDMYAVNHVIAHSTIPFDTCMECCQDVPDQKGKWTFWAKAFDVKRNQVTDLKKIFRQYLI